MSSERIKVIIVDDEPLGRDRVRMFAARRDDLQIIWECANGPAAVRSILEMDPDLVFLDVQMPEMDGFGVIREIGVDQMPAVIFVTAHDEHAVQAFEVHAMDYLVKPFRAARFTEAVDRAVEIVRNGSNEHTQGLGSLMSQSRRYLDRILAKSARKAYFVKLDQIEWIEAAGNYLRLHDGSKVHLIRKTMSDIVNQLDPDRFVRIHRSSIVNLEHIDVLERTDGGEYVAVLSSGRRLKISRGYKTALNRFDPMTANFAR